MNMPFISLIGSGVKLEGGGGNRVRYNLVLVFVVLLFLLETGGIIVEPNFTPTKQKTEYLSNRVRHTAFYTNKMSHHNFIFNIIPFFPSSIPWFLLLDFYKYYCSWSESVMVNTPYLPPPPPSGFVVILWQFTCILLYYWVGGTRVRI